MTSTESEQIDWKDFDEVPNRTPEERIRNLEGALRTEQDRVDFLLEHLTHAHETMTKVYEMLDEHLPITARVIDTHGHRGLFERAKW